MTAVASPARGEWSRLLLLAAAASLPAVAPAQTASDLIRRDYDRQRVTELAEAGQRHLQLGSWARKAGLVGQATAQFLKAVEAAEGNNPGAVTVLNLMRGLGDGFWRGERKRPPRSLLNDCAKRVAQVERENRKAHLRLAKLAGKAHLADRQREHLLAALKLGAELEWTKTGPKVDGDSVDDATAKWLEAQCRPVNGGEKRFEPAGARAPKLDGVQELRSELLVVRGDLPASDLARLHALGEALWPQLQQRLEGAPGRPLQLFVFQKRADYDAYQRACGRGVPVAARGLCDYGTFQTLVAAEGLGSEDLEALVLHELSHLFWFGTAPVAMPDWYAEGFAESIGGQGTFRFDGKALTLGGMLRQDRLQDLQANPLAVRDILAGDAMRQLAADPAQGARFYAAAWALHRWLTTTPSPWRERFAWWEDECRGALPGVQSTARTGDPGPARAAFERLFAADLDALDTAFQAWLKGL